MGPGSQTVETKQQPSGLSAANQFYTTRIGTENFNMPYSSYPYSPIYNQNWNPNDPNSDPYLGGYRNVLTGEAYRQTDPLTGGYQMPPFQSMLAAMPQETQQGLQALIQRAMTGSPIMNAAQGNLADTLSGKYLTAESNPYISGMYDAAARKMTNTFMNTTAPMTNAMFDRAGAFGGSAHRLYQAQQAQDLQQGLGDMASQMYGQAYGDERQRQLQAALVGPQIAQQDYADIQALLSAGDIKQQDAQQRLNELVNYVKGYSQWPYQQASTVSSLLQPTYNLSQTTTSPNPAYVSPASQLMGGLMTGGGMLLGLGGMGGLGANPLLNGWGFF